MVITVVLAEDDPSVRQAIKTYLSRAADIEFVDTAAGSEVALALTRDRHPVIADIHMPKVSGVDLTSRLDAELPAIPALIFTALGDDQVI